MRSPVVAFLLVFLAFEVALDCLVRVLALVLPLAMTVAGDWVWSGCWVLAIGEPWSLFVDIVVELVKKRDLRLQICL